LFAARLIAAYIFALKKRPAECISRALVKKASIYIPMGNEKNEDCNDREANLCTDAQATKE
jgi:hypothetical protein